MSAQPPYLAYLDAGEIDRFARLTRHQQLPLGSFERRGQLIGRKQGIDRFDQFGGITLNAGQLLREKAAVDEKLQFCAVRVVDAIKRGRDLCFRTKCEHGKKQPEGTEL